MSRQDDEIEATKISELPDQAELDPLVNDVSPEQADQVPSTKLQRAHAQKIEAELNLRKYELEHEIEKLEQSQAAKAQLLALVSKQASLKQEELQNLRSEVKDLDDAVSHKRLAVESLKTSIESERQDLTSLRNAASDLQLDIQKLSDHRLAQQQFLLDHDRQIHKYQQRQNVILDDIRKIEEELEALQDLLTSEKTKLEALLHRQQETQDIHDERLEKSHELDKKIHAQRDILAAIIDDCQDKARTILSEARQNAEQMQDEAQKAAELFIQESQQKAQATASDKILTAENSADKIVSTARLEAAKLLAGSRDKSRLLVEEAETHAAKVNARAQSYYEQSLEEARREVGSLISKAQSEGEQITLEARKRAEQLHTSAYEEKQRIVEAAEHAQRKITDEAQETSRKQIEQVNRYAKEVIDEAENKRQSLQAEIDGLAGFLEVEKKKFYQALETERQQLLQGLNDERQKLAVRIHEEHKRLDAQRQQLIDDYNKEKNQLYQEVNIEKAQAEQKAQALFRAAEEERNTLEAKLNERRLEFERELQSKKDRHEQELLERTQKLSEEWDRKGEKIAKSLELKGQELAEQAQTMKLKAEQEIKELRGRTERELVQQRIQQETALQNWVKGQQENFHAAQNRHRNQILDTIAALVQSAIRSQVTGLDPARLAQLSAVTRKAAEEAFLDAEKQTQAVSLNAPQTSGSNNHFKDLRYWRNLFLHSSMKWGALALALSLAGFLWNHYSEDRSMSAANSYVADQIKQRKKAPYTPEQSRSFKGSYTDNVLFTTDYLEHERHKSVRNRWIVALNRYGIEKLDMNNEVIVKLLAKEATLLKQLEKMKGDIDGKAPNPDIARMREVEDKYRQQLITIVGSDDKFKAFINFKTNYFEKILQQNLD